MLLQIGVAVILTPMMLLICGIARLVEARSGGERGEAGVARAGPRAVVGPVQRRWSPPRAEGGPVHDLR